MLDPVLWKDWVTFQEVIPDIVRVRPKHKNMSCDDWRISKQWFQTLAKLTHYPSDGIESTGVNGRGKPICLEQPERYNIRVYLCTTKKPTRFSITIALWEKINGMWNSSTRCFLHLCLTEMQHTADAVIYCIANEWVRYECGVTCQRF